MDYFSKRKTARSIHTLQPGPLKRVVKLEAEVQNMSNRSTNSKNLRREEKPRRNWQQIVFIVISVILVLAWILSLVSTI